MSELNKLQIDRDQRDRNYLVDSWQKKGKEKCPEVVAKVSVEAHVIEASVIQLIIYLLFLGVA